MKQTTNKNPQCRKWQGTLNHPSEHGYTREEFIKKCLSIKNIEYIAFSEEIAPTTQTPHFHVFLYRSSGMYFNALKKLIPECHWENVKGTCEENRDYVFKIGKWIDTEKKEGNLADSHYEYGECPQEEQGKRNDLVYMYDLVKQGCTDSEILEACTETAVKYLDKIGRIRLAHLKDKFRNERRLDLKVHYVCGKTGTGKSRNILDEYGDANVYRVTDYQHPFDSYQSEPVIVFEEFRSSLKLQDMLNYLDVYSFALPARYAPKQCCYTTVFVVSNWDFEQQYPDVQKDSKQKSSYEAWVRRFNGTVKVYTAPDTYTEYATMQDYLKRNEKFHPIPDNSKTPFDVPKNHQEQLDFDNEADDMPFND